MYHLVVNVRFKEYMPTFWITALIKGRTTGIKQYTRSKRKLYALQDCEKQNLSRPNYFPLRSAIINSSDKLLNRIY